MVKGTRQAGVDEPRRMYESPRRREQARATTVAVLDAAHELFLARGYASTTVQAIATRAGVSVETIYSAFTNKRSVLASVLDRSIVGDDDPVPVLDRTWVAELRQEPDQGLRVRMLARQGAAILARRSPIDRILRDAASTDPAIARMWATGTSQRLDGQRRVARMVIGPEDRRSDTDLDELTDTLFAIGSPEVYELLVVDRGWSHARFAAWYEAMLLRLFLDRPATL